MIFRCPINLSKVLSVALLLAWMSLAFPGFAEEPDTTVHVRGGPYMEYTRAGINTFTLGPALYIVRYNKFSDVLEIGYLYANAGWAWTRKTNNVYMTSGGLVFGFWPGLTMGLSSQQYHDIELENGKKGTDIRLSAEIDFAYFGWLGYRYQYPLNRKFESPFVSRHAFVVQIPVPIFGKNYSPSVGM